MFFSLKKNKIKKEKAFTLIEMLISISLFTIVVTISFSALFSIMNANAKAKTMKLVINNLNMAMESMTREIRVGYRYTCSSAPSPTTNGTDCSGGGRIIFIAENGDKVAYRFSSSNKTIERTRNGKIVSLIGDDVNIEDLKFYVHGTGTGDNIQPRVLIVLKGAINRENEKTEFNIQTTVSQRKIAP